MTLLFGSLLVASGAAGLIYEILWTRQLALIFGVSSFAIATVLAVFMGGLGSLSWPPLRWRGGGWGVGFPRPCHPSDTDSGPRARYILQALGRVGLSPFSLDRSSWAP